MSEPGRVGVLDGKRAIDLTDVEGWLCGMLLAGFGAEVIRVEPPGGDPGRHLPPIARDVPGDFSLYWLAWNRGKKSVVLDVEDRAGRKALRRLVDSADFLVESGPPGHLRPLGLDFEAVRGSNPALVYVSISPFGQTGPFAAYKASDLVAQAAGGHLYLDGTVERPLRPSVDTVYAQAGVQASVGAMIAHYAREASGRGQLVDLSLQEAVAFTLDEHAPGWDIRHQVHHHYGDGRVTSDARLKRTAFRCRDGWVATLTYFNIAGGNPDPGLELLRLAGVPHDDLLTEENQAWMRDPWHVLTHAQEERCIELAGQLAAHFTKADLSTECHRLRIWGAEVLSPRELLDHPHLTAREFWVSAEVPELGMVRVPGPPFIMHETPWVTPRTLASIGEHTDQVLGALTEKAR